MPRSPNRPADPPVTALLNRFPNGAELSRVLGVSHAAVASWKHRGSVPERWWRALARAAAELQIEGVTYQALSDATAGLAPGSEPDR